MNYNKSLSQSWLLIVLTACLASCASNKTQPDAISNIHYPEPMPDSLPIIFLPGIVSKDTLDFNSAFSNDGSTFYFARSRNRKYVILETSYKDHKWQEAAISPLFDTLYSNADPFIAADSALYFISNRPKDKNDTTDDYDIYRMVKQGNTYAGPEYLTGVNSDSTEYYVSVSRSGNIYFSSYRDGNLDLYMSKRTKNGYDQPINLGVTINSAYDEHDPLIAPDESFLVFTSSRPGGLGQADLYITHKTNGQWGNPTNMGSIINTKTYEYCPNLSPDGKYFFYSSEFQVKWVGSEVLRKKG
ncbi:hypothetical protein FAM09_11745 [Niastella caeni]|uniref:Uncharacterized protein n=1 Tax=Niastella caeni TaxID=2569763 RepID=A0A4S8I0K4_9BACT|nr:PD40 domain-containing protein [Niastella caeni]THU39182.1 hypothetical protein FAM09_11745 [Niastella caeni]